MAVKPTYCSHCSAIVVTQLVEGRERSVCSRCGAIFYENPLPVAACVVLNPNHEVLLVKRAREPHQGMWCLPMGFAETGETIAEAALRELEEETGIKARVLRMLDTQSYESDFYGDLLMVTYEAEKIGGDERPGDDALEVEYFPVGDLPLPLAWAPNETAIEACVAAHQEAWAIEDSFSHLQADSGEMLSDVLVGFIQQNAETIASLWLNEVRTSPSTTSYRRLDPDELLAHADDALYRFGRWLKGHEADDEVRAFYWDLGARRWAQQFELSEVLSSLTLLKRQIWMTAGSRGAWDRPIDVYRVLELSRRIGTFFDRAIYYTSRGFDSNRYSDVWQSGMPWSARRD